MNEQDNTLVLRVSDLSKRFGGVAAMKPLTLSVRDGERLSVIGTNGAGKSTMFNLVAGSLLPSTGTIELFGREVTSMSPQRRAQLGLSRTFQTSELFTELTVLENVFLALGKGRGSTALLPARFFKARWAKARELLSRMELNNRERAKVADLSHGEQRQLEVCMALATDPKLLMLDEPAAGLSPAERGTLLTLLRALPREVTLVLIEHDMDIALAVADRVAVMHDGHLVEEGPPQQIRQSTLVHEIYLGGSLDDVA